MARQHLDPAVLAHLEWLGFVKPTGLVVSAPALVRAGAILDRSDTHGQRLLRDCLANATSARPADGGGAVHEAPVLTYGASAPSAPAFLPDFRRFAGAVLGWSLSPKGYAGTEACPVPAELEVALPEYGEVLRPDLAVREPEPDAGRPPWQLLVRLVPRGQGLDDVVRGHGGLEATAQGRMERLLRQSGVPAGLLFNGEALRLVSAPKGESSGWLDFRVADMVQTAGRPISTAMRLLLSESRLLTLPRPARLAALLEDSRRYQNQVSERLAEQVLHALYELLRGLQAADDASKGELLRRTLAEHPDAVYRALLTVILRLVFLLYAEERDMLPQNEAFLRHYGLAGLHERLRADAALYPDTMDQRYGAWAQLLVLFRMVHDGARGGAMRLPRRHGVLFDPERFPFLEGRAAGAAQASGTRVEVPLVPDGTIWRALEKLLILDGERISYRALDVEQIGSVYETMMGFRLERATGLSLAVKASKRGGAPAAVDLEALLCQPGKSRAKWLGERTDRKLTPTVAGTVAKASSLEDLHAALRPVTDEAATPDLVPKGAMVLQPSEERRRSGSHYTPRSLTEPIVRTTLDPILARLRGKGGRPPRPEAVLDLKVCDPAMGSGAFLVEACRYLGDTLLESWHAHDARPAIPPDEDEVVLARRLVAQRCLYGVDRNPVAVDLAKMSLWLATLAKDHPLTFVDHALRHGDSLVGLSRRQIEGFHWDADAPRFQSGFEAVKAHQHLARFAELRRRIRQAGEGATDQELRRLWDEAQSELAKVRLLGDLVVAAWFESEKPGEREAKRVEFASAVVGGEAERWRGPLERRRHEDPPLAPFHWEIEFPEVFGRERSGFDALIGNPPFMGGSKISSTQGTSYLDWLLALHEGSHGNGDLVAHFFRRGFALLREGGTFGLIATNTIAQGDTRASGLRWICTHGGEIYAVRKRVKWPGAAAVVVSVVHVTRGRFEGPRRIDEREVERVTAFLFHRGSHEDPECIVANGGNSFMGSKIYGQGFTFDGTDTEGAATPLAEMARLLAQHPACREVVFPYIGGEELNSSPTHAHHRFVINFGERSEEECRGRWPELMAIVEAKVKPERMRNNRDLRKRYWWRFGETTPALFTAIAGLERVLAISQVSSHLQLAFLPARIVFAHTAIVFPLSSCSAFCALQARPHEIWARFFGSSMKDDLRYTPSDCFETFPFPKGWESHSALESSGREYYEFRAALMIRNDEGLTKTYNRFHDPDERDSGILRLRDLHASMDKAVLEAYGWGDVPTKCEFILDYEDDDEEESSGRKKPWRYRWPDDVRDEILARLLDLNATRAKEEQRAGAGAEAAAGAKRVRKRTPKPGETGDWFA